MHRASAWVSPEEQDRRIGAMRARMEARELEELRARCASGEWERDAAIVASAARRRARDEEDARALAHLRARSEDEVAEGLRALDAQWKGGRR